MYSKTIIVGHLGRDPEMRYTQSGVPVTSFSVATTRRWSSASGEQQEKTTWFRVTCWRKLAELTAQYLRKGRLVLIEGEVDSSAFTDKKTNEPRSSLELTAATVKFLGPKGEGEPSEAHDDGPTNDKGQSSAPSDGIPAEWQG